jgi:hypothetical protein
MYSQHVNSRIFVSRHLSHGVVSAGYLAQVVWLKLTRASCLTPVDLYYRRLTGNSVRPPVAKERYPYDSEGALDSARERGRLGWGDTFHGKC